MGITNHEDEQKDLTEQKMEIKHEESPIDRYSPYASKGCRSYSIFDTAPRYSYYGPIDRYSPYGPRPRYSYYGVIVCLPHPDDRRTKIASLRRKMQELKERETEIASLRRKMQVFNGLEHMARRSKESQEINDRKKKIASLRREIQEIKRRLIFDPLREIGYIYGIEEYTGRLSSESQGIYEKKASLMRKLKEKDERGTIDMHLELFTDWHKKCKITSKEKNSIARFVETDNTKLANKRKASSVIGIFVETSPPKTFKFATNGTAPIMIGNSSRRTFICEMCIHNNIAEMMCKSCKMKICKKCENMHERVWSLMFHNRCKIEQ